MRGWPSIFTCKKIVFGTPIEAASKAIRRSSTSRANNSFHSSLSATICKCQIGITNGKTNNTHFKISKSKATIVEEYNLKQLLSPHRAAKKCSSKRPQSPHSHLSWAYHDLIKNTHRFHLVSLTWGNSWVRFILGPCVSQKPATLAARKIYHFHPSGMDLPR
jgi:hypothetical protein